MGFAEFIIGPRFARTRWITPFYSLLRPWKPRHRNDAPERCAFRGDCAHRHCQRHCTRYTGNAQHESVPEQTWPIFVSGQRSALRGTDLVRFAQERQLV